jgi:transposase
MFPTATALSVDDVAKAQLESLVRSGTTPQRVAQKCRVILLAQEGMSNHSIAKQLGLSRPTVIAARATFGTGGVQALTAKPTRNRPRWTLTAELEKKILDTTLKTRPPDATQWTVRTLAKHLRVSRMMVHRVWQRFDIQPHRVEKFKLSNDTQHQSAFRRVQVQTGDIAHLFLKLRIEKSQIQALDRTAPILPLRPGLPERQTHDYKRYGTTTLFAAFNILNGKVIGTCLPRHRGKEFAKFLNQVEKQVPPDLDVHIILDNYSTHKSATVKRWLHSRHFHFHFTPTSSSWLNQVERFFALITERMIRRGTFHSVEELEHAIYAWLAN